MVGSEYVGVDFCIYKSLFQTVGGYEVVNAPAYILLSGLKTI